MVGKVAKKGEGRRDPKMGSRNALPLRPVEWNSKRY